VDKLEKKIDDGFAKVDRGFAETRAQIVSSEQAVRSDARADFRTLIAVVFSLWAATVLAVVGVLVSQL